MISDNESINIALVEDDREDAFLLRRALQRSGIEFQLTHLERLSDALEYLEGNTTDVVVLDLGLPDGDGLDCLEKVQKVAPHVPVVILTGNDNDDNALSAVESGAQDYLKKGNMDGREIARSLAYAIHRKKAESHLRTGVYELQHAAETDELTGVSNRRTMLSFINNAWNTAKHTCVPIACVMMDLDFFKRVNDTYGHQVGDEVLVAVAGALKSVSRATDMIARYGGEEFCALLPSTTEEQAAQWAERARRAISDTTLHTRKGELTVTVSLGVAVGPNGCGQPTDLIDRADQALLVSKQCGKDRVSAFSKIDDALRIDDSCLEEFPEANAPARELMTSPIQCLLSTESLANAVSKLLEIGTNSMPVIDTDGALVGVISEKDLIEWKPVGGQWEPPIAEVMNTTVIAYQENEPLEKIRQFFSRVSIRKVVIVKGNRPVGVLSRSDILRHYQGFVKSAEFAITNRP